MKKYISLIGALALGTTTSLTVVACGETTNDDTTPVPSNPATENINLWSNQTSNIAKSLILSKNENFNTNRVLNNALNITENNILKNTDPNTGSSYTNFKNVWGYKGNIEGFEEKDFNNDQAATVDGDLIKTKEEISSVINQIKDPLNQIKAIAAIPEIITPGIVFLALDGAKDSLSTTLYGLKENPEIINMIKSLLPSIAAAINSFDAFNPETALEGYYDENITKALFGENNDGWLANYEAIPGFGSEAVKNNSSILSENYFQDWDQVALFKSSIDLNAFVYQMSGNTKSLGDLFNNAIKYNGNTVTDLDLNQLFTEFQAIWSSSPENIIGLISNLIPIVKYQLLDINPTKPLTKLTTKEASNAETGVVNISEVLTKVQEILLTKEGFTDFISKIFFAKSETEFSLGNYFTFDLTMKNNQTLSSALFSIKDQLTAKLDSVYTETVEPIMNNAHIKDILNKIAEDLAELTDKTGFEFELTQFQEILRIVDGVWPFIDKIMTYESKDELVNDWDGLWATLGLIRGETKFPEGSVFDSLKKFLVANKGFLPSLSNLVDEIAIIVPDIFDVMVEKETTAKIDFKNESLWSINDSTFSYNASLDETTINYTLTDKTQETSKTYSVTVVVKGNADTALTEARQVWLKALNPLN